MADAALWLALGPRTVRLDISAATSARSKSMGTTPPRGANSTPPPRPWLTTKGTEAKPFDVARHSASRHAEVARELSEAHPLAVGGVQALDQRLLPFYPAQREVIVARRRGKSGTAVHMGMLSRHRPVWFAL
jgi:hypothetical protein